MKAYLLSSIAVLMLAGTAGKASAAIVTETFTGTVLNNGLSFDLAGLFGSASNNSGALDGDAFKLVFTIDTALGTGSFSDAGSQFKSGQAYSLPQAVSASIEINGFTQQVFGSWFGTASQSNNPSAGSTGLSTLDTGVEDTGYGSAEVHIQVFDPAIPGNLLTPFTFDPAAQNVFTDASGGFNIGAHSNEAGGSLDITGVSVQVSSVPLPASLPMFGAAILGLGAVGFAVKKRKGSALAA